MRRPLFSLFAGAAALALGAALAAQSVPEIPYEAHADLLKLPDNIHLGEAAGVATNSKGHIFVYTRTGAAHATVGTSRTFYKAGSRLFEFDQTGKFVREIGVGVYGFNNAQAVRIDAQDNIWVVDRGSTQVIKFDPDGRIQLVMSRKPEAIAVRAPVAGAGRGGGGGGRGPAGPPGAGIPGDSFVRTAGVAWDTQGNVYVADGQGDGIGNARVAKFDKDAHFIKSWGQRGAEPGQFNSLRGIAIDAKGLVYVADGGNKRIQVFDADGNPKAQIEGVGVPAAICITPGTHQYIYVSNSNDAESLDNGEIYKMELDGKIVGKFGRAGRVPKEFNMVNQIDCRSENDLLVAELGNWRVQKLTLHPR
ncbi:MAG: peptidyl-alpha-hydroxyglycine alpha-amidating lyase family protein [Vicinamibacterales bacterium]